MSDRIKPRDGEEVQKAVAWALGEGKRLEIIGAGSKRGVGRPSQSDMTIDLSGLTGITLYEPEELVLAAHAGTPVSAVQMALAEHCQELAFEPVDLGPVLGAPAGMATLGGVLAANLAGPRRIKSGAARDHFLGVSAVSGRGETFKSGGRVVKNVTGYDLCKILAGSWGTLAVMSEVTVKVLPAAETQATLVVSGLDDGAGAHAMSAALGSNCEVSAAAHLPREIAERSQIDAIAATAASATVLRLEGFAPSVSYRKEKLTVLLTPFGPVSETNGDVSAALWREVGNVTAFAQDISLPLWRISVAPMDGYKVVRRILANCQARYCYDWGGGLIWLELADSDSARAVEIRAAIAGISGHATLMRAAPSIRANVAVFQPQPAALAALSARLKHSFDPEGMFNPGRLEAGS